MSKHVVCELIKSLGGEIKVAEMIDVDQRTVAFWKQRGWIGLDYVLRLANIAKVDPIDLVYERLATPNSNRKNNKDEIDEIDEDQEES